LNPAARREDTDTSEIPERGKFQRLKRDGKGRVQMETD
jgi:hypothetical protein